MLITRPNHDPATNYLYYWSQELIDLAKERGNQVVDLAKKRANAEEFASVMKKVQPSLVVLNGHGNSSVVGGYNNEPLIIAGENDVLLSKTIVYALSCKTGQVLGPKSVTVGAISYIGYKEDFNFWHNSTYSARPLGDSRAKLFFDPSNQIGLSLLKGHTVKESYSRAKNSFLRNIQQLVVSNSPDQFVIPDLIWDMVHLDYFGSDRASVV